MKKMFIVSAIMLFAVGAMTSCKDSVENGCHCTVKATYEGQSASQEFDVEAAQLKEENYKSCSAFAADAQKAAKEEMGLPEGAEISVSCKGK